MKSFSIQTSPELINEDINAHKSEQIDLLLVFSSRHILTNTKSLLTLKSIFPDVQMIGCSTSGEIGAILCTSRSKGKKASNSRATGKTPS